MRTKMVTMISLAVLVAGCGEKIDAQESAVESKASAELPAEAMPAPDDSEAPGEAVKMQSPVGLD
jgi:hypothetical protein